MEHYSEIKKRNIDNCYNVDKTWKHAKWKNSDTKGCIFHDSVWNRTGKSIQTEKREVIANG